MPILKKQSKKCLNCSEQPSRNRYKYCSNSCQRDFEYQTYINGWKNAELSGLQGAGIVSGYIKRYLREKFNDKCALCGWSKINPKTKVAPLVADHIDGDWRNNTESNLRLVCPNCDSLSPTYAGSNRGNGRKGRVVSNRVKEARLLIASATK